MSKYDYVESRKIDSKGYSFDALIMASMRKADDINIGKLKSVFPEIHKELIRRYNTPGGMLPGETTK